MPVVANGDIRTEEDITRVHQTTGVNGNNVIHNMEYTCGEWGVPIAGGTSPLFKRFLNF